MCPGGPDSNNQHADTCTFDPRSQEVYCNCYPGYMGELAKWLGLKGGKEVAYLPLGGILYHPCSQFAMHFCCSSGFPKCARH